MASCGGLQDPVRSGPFSGAFGTGSWRLAPACIGAQPARGRAPGRGCGASLRAHGRRVAGDRPAVQARLRMAPRREYGGGQRPECLRHSLKDLPAGRRRRSAPRGVMGRKPDGCPRRRVLRRGLGPRRVPSRPRHRRIGRNAGSGRNSSPCRTLRVRGNSCAHTALPRGVRRGAARLHVPARHYVRRRVRVHEHADATLSVFHGSRRLARFDVGGALLAETLSVAAG